MATNNYKNINEALDERNDISNFVVHLTKDTSNGSALENLLSIINDEKIRAYNHHCLFSHMLNTENLDIQKKFYSTCFTETPLENIKYLLDIRGRQVNLQPYGLVFLKQTLLEKGGNPAIYTFQEDLKNYFIKMYDNNINPHFGSLINVVKDKHDFYWEREWRINGDFNFNCFNIIAIIAPEEKHESIRQSLKDSVIKKIIIIDPKWSYKNFVFELSRNMNIIYPF